MSNKRLSVILAVVTLLGVAAFIIQTRPMIPAVAPNAAEEVPDYFQRHPEVIIQRTNVEPLDYFQRHPDSLKPGNAVDLADSFRQHAEALSR
jgi:hypothetical protein